MFVSRSAVVRFCALCGVLVVAGLAEPTYGIFAPAAAQLGALYNPGAGPIGIPAVSITPSASGLSATGYHTNPTIYTALTTPSPQGPLAGRLPDYHWVADGTASVGQNWIWNFSFSKTDYWLYPAIDHTPVPDEALEVTLWGSPNGGSSWIQGKLVEVYELGWDPNLAVISDDGASRWSFGTAVNMITATPGLVQGTYAYNGGGDYEIDAIMQTPEPASLLMLAGGGLLMRRRRLGLVKV
jgi:hypothetical protein